MKASRSRVAKLTMKTAMRAKQGTIQKYKSTALSKKGAKSNPKASSKRSAKSSRKSCASSKRASKTKKKVMMKRISTAAKLVEKMEEVNWVPLESNPEMMNTFAHAVGLPEDWSFVDVLGVDPELLQMVPRPCVAVMLLYECSTNLERYKRRQKAEIKVSGQTLSEKLFFMKQYVGNACGTIAAIHCLANSAERLDVPKDSSLGKFLAQTQRQSPEAIGAALADFSEFHEASEESAEGGQTEAPEADEELNRHFVAFVEQDGDVYELDGTKAFPINHGPAADGLLNAATQVIKSKFMAQDVDNIYFNMMALAKV